MFWRRLGDTPLSQPMMVSSLTHLCVTRPQCVSCLVGVKSQMVLCLKTNVQWFIKNHTAHSINCVCQTHTNCIYIISSCNPKSTSAFCPVYHLNHQYKDNTVVRPPYLYNGITHTSVPSIYQIHIFSPLLYINSQIFPLICMIMLSFVICISLFE